MRRILFAIIMGMPILACAQTESTQQDRVEVLKAKAEAAIKAAKAAQEAAEAAQKAAIEAAEAAQKAAEAELKANAEEKAKAAAKEKEEPKVVQEEISRKEEKTSEVTVKANENKPQGNSSWSAPVVIAEEEDDESENKVPEEVAVVEEPNIYLAPDAIPEVNGKVVWTYDLDVPGKSAGQIYDEMLKFMTKMTKGKNQLERSKVALVNEKEHRIAATMQEWLVFSSTFLSLDRTKLNYVLQANCTDGHLQVIMDRITYNYGEEGGTVNYKAEEWITDKYAINKKRTRMYPVSGKFRRKTIDRKNEIFKEIKAAIL